jgi:hypothetical protein
MGVNGVGRHAHHDDLGLTHSPRQHLFRQAGRFRHAERDDRDQFAARFLGGDLNGGPRPFHDIAGHQFGRAQRRSQNRLARAVKMRDKGQAIQAARVGRHDRMRPFNAGQNAQRAKRRTHALRMELARFRFRLWCGHSRISKRNRCRHKLYFASALEPVLQFLKRFPLPARGQCGLLRPGRRVIDAGHAPGG